LNSYELTLTTPSRWRVYQFHHLGLVWQEWEDSNPRPAVLETAALPAELHSLASYYFITSIRAIAHPLFCRLYKSS
jgi:hypothetical protein